jgi:type VI secretion system protein ImpL
VKDTLTQIREAPGLLKWLPLVLMLVVLGALIVWVVRDLRARFRAAPPKPKPPRVRLHLRRVWRDLLRRTPPAQRRALGLFQPFILVGDAGAGKSALIERYIDWRGHEAQFQPSHIDDPRLQIYRGVNALVQELSATVLDDTSPVARKALRRLWRPLQRGRDPKVVIALDATRLIRIAPEELTRRAQVVRGKLDLLAELLRRPVEVTLVVTKADQLAGYLDLAELLRTHDAALRVRSATPDGPLDLEGAFARFEAHLPSLLAGSPAAAYLNALVFFEELPTLLRPLDVFVRTLQSADSIAPVPVVRTVAIESNEQGPGAWSPFATAITDADLRRFHPMRKHAIAAGAVAGAAAIYMLSGYAAALGRIGEGSRRLDALLEAPGDGEAQAAWLGALDDSRRSLARRLLPAFFDRDGTFGYAELRRRFVTGVHERLLVPALTAAERKQQSTTRLYVLTLLHASNIDRLGRFIVAHAGEWGDALGLPPSLVRAWVEAKDPSLAPPGDWRGLTAQAAAVELALQTPELSRLVFELQGRLAQPYMTAAQLQGLKALVAPARRDAQALLRRDNLAAALALLADETGIDVAGTWRTSPAASGPAPAAVAELTALVEHAELDDGDASPLDLAGLAARLSPIAAAKPVTALPIVVALDGKTVTIDPAAWERLLQRSRATLAARAFAARAEDGVAALFADAAAYSPVIVSARGAGCRFDGDGRIEGVFTAQAVTAHVAPALTELAQLLPKLPLSKEEKEQLTDHITEAVGAYADEYAERYRSLLTSVRCHARSLPELRLLAVQLPSPSSPLRAALREIARNTALTLPHGNALGAPLDAVAEEFAALRALAPATGQASQLDGWVAVLRALQLALDGRGPPPPPDKEPENGLRSKLSPLGRIALAIYRGDEDSPKVQVERWLTAANVDTDAWPPFAAPVEEAYELGRQELHKTLSESWGDLLQTHLQPLAETFPFKRDAQTPATPPLLEAALAPKQAFWSGFDAAVAPVLTAAREGWRAREGRSSPLLPGNLLPTANRLSALSSLLWDKDGKPKPLLVRVRPLPLQLTHPEKGGAPLLMASYLSVGATTVYGFNQRPDWTTLKIEWWHPDTAAVGVALAANEAGKIYRAVTQMDTPWSLWRLLLRATSSGGRIFTWQVPGPDGRSMPVQFEMKDDPWTQFALH